MRVISIVEGRRGDARSPWRYSKRHAFTSLGAAVVFALVHLKGRGADGTGDPLYGYGYFDEGSQTFIRREQINN